MKNEIKVRSRKIRISDKPKKILKLTAVLAISVICVCCCVVFRSDLIERN